MRKLLLLVSIAAVASISSAQVIFSSLAPDDTWNSSSWFIQGHDTPNSNWRQAVRFQSGAAGFLEEVRWAAGYNSGTLGSDTVTIRRDNAGEPGAAVLNMIGFNGNTTNPGGIHGVNGIQTSFNFNIAIGAGEWLWFEFYDQSADGYYEMYLNDEGIMQTRRASSDGDDTWEISDTQLAPAYELSVVPVPEPASMAALGLGVLALLRRKRKTA